MQYVLSQEESNLLQSNQIKFENPNSSLPLQRFTVHLLTSLNPRKPKVRQRRISRILLAFISTITDLFHIYYVNTALSETSEKNKDIVLTKPNKGNGVVILDWKFYDSAIQEIISDTFKFAKLNEDPTLKRKVPLQRF